MGRSSSISASEKKGSKSVDLTPPDFTVDDIVEQIKRQLTTTEEGMTNREITIALGLPATTTNMGRTYKQLNDLIAKEVVECVGKKDVQIPTGGTQRTKAYALKKTKTANSPQ